MEINTEFDLNEIVIIRGLNIEGKIARIILDGLGTEYQVFYLNQGEMTSSYFWAENLRKKGASPPGEICL